MGRSFRYNAAPEVVRAYVTDLGYQTDDAHYQHGGEPFGFTIRDTTIQVSYPTISKHSSTGDLITAIPGVVSLDNNPYSSGYTHDKAERSISLYRKLYRRFRSRNLA